MSKNFKPIMISFFEDDYKEAEEKAKSKLELLDKASVWIHNQLDNNIKINMRKLSVDMVTHFEDLVLEFYKDQNQLGLSAKKLIEVKEINIYELQKIDDAYSSIQGKVITNGNIPSIKVQRRDFETWTTNDKQNKNLLLGNKLISALNDFGKEKHIYQSYITQATGGYIRYDMAKQRYYVNNEFIFG
jgi:hypothetical protein